MFIRLLIVASLFICTGTSLQAADNAQVPAGKTAYTVYLASLPDRTLIGKKVNVIARRVSNHSARPPELKVILQDVLLISSPEYNEWGGSDRQATLALSPQEQKKLAKVAKRVGVDILILSRETP
jgi:hypothetical protein